jgi:hypothetical protein
VSRILPLYSLFSVLALAVAPVVNASPYIEAGTSYGTYSAGQSYFGNANASQGSGFLGSLSLYFPVTSERAFAHLDLGLQNRFLSASDSTGAPLAMGSSEIGARLEISRFYVGGAYAPITYVSKSGSGVTSLHPNSGVNAYLLEAGAIWRVVPELQICFDYSLEIGLLSGGGGSSPSPVSELGIRFRFPLDPAEHQGGKGVDFDGFRYPFGFMK